MKYPEYKKYMKDSIGRYRTASLFYDFHKEKNEHAVYTLREEDREGYEGRKVYSAKKIYLELNDPTEYAVAIALFGSYKHWQKIRNNPLFKPHFDEWATELEIKMRSEGIRNIAKISKQEDQNSTTLSAAKFIANKEWEGKNTKGRPSKEEITKQAKIHAGIKDELDDDFKRLNIEAIN